VNDLIRARRPDSPKKSSTFVVALHTTGWYIYNPYTKYFEKIGEQNEKSQ